MNEKILQELDEKLQNDNMDAKAIFTLYLSHYISLCGILSKKEIIKIKDFYNINITNKEMDEVIKSTNASIYKGYYNWNKDFTNDFLMI